MTVLQFLQKTRIEQAVHLLRTTDMSVDDIADAVGYHDIGFFNNLFGRFIGTNPGRYRREVLANHYGANVTKDKDKASMIFFGQL